MVVLGIDIGTQFSCVASPQGHSLDIVLNEQSKRYTPTVVSFDDTDGRCYGDAAVSRLRRFPRQTIVEVKRLLGRAYDDPKLADDLKWWGFRVVRDRREGMDFCAVEATVGGKTVRLTGEAILASFLQHVKENTKNMGKDKKIALKDVKDCAIAVPCYFTEAQRRAVVSAGRIAGLSVLRVCNELTATALNYGIVRPSPDPKSKNRTLFIDIGYGNTQAAVVDFAPQELTVVSHSGNPNTGGRDLIRSMVTHFAVDVQKKFRRDIFDKKNFKLLVRLEQACQRLLKLLSINKLASCTIDCLADDRDYTLRLARADFEDMVKPLVTEMIKTVALAVEKAKLADPSTEVPILTTELTGGIVRVPCVRAAINEYCGSLPGFKAVQCTLNGDESVSRGCALISAMCSTAYRVRQYKVNDCSMKSIHLAWNCHPESGELFKKIMADPQSVNSLKDWNTAQLFKSGCVTPSTKMATIPFTSDLCLVARYGSESVFHMGQSPIIGRFFMKHPPEAIEEQALTGKNPRLKITLRLDANQMLSKVVSQMNTTRKVEEEEEPKEEAEKKEEKTEETPTEKEAGGEAMKTDPPPQESTDMKTDPPSETTTEEPTKSTEEAPAAEAPAAEKPKPKKKKPKTKTVTVATERVILGCLTDSAVVSAIGVEKEMYALDKLIKETAHARNRLESYIYSLRDDLDMGLSEYATPATKEDLRSLMGKLEIWLEEGEETEHVLANFNTRYQELSASGEAIRRRKYCAEARPQRIKSLKVRCQTYIDVVNAKEKEHLEADEKEKVVKKANEIDQWLSNMLIKQSKIPLTDEPILTPELIIQREDELSRFCDPIVNKPKPKPPEPKKEEETKESKDAEKENPEKSTESEKVPEEMSTDKGATEAASSDAKESAEMNVD